MDYTECCRAKCTELYANCDAVDADMTVRNDNIYPTFQGGSVEQTECCYATDCETWRSGGGTCGDKVLRSDRHGCSEGSCDAEECCQDKDADPDESSQECKDAKAITNKDEADANNIYTAQCYNLDMSADTTDPTKWIAKKGPGSCTVCLDALKKQFGPDCKFIFLFYFY